MRLLVKAHKFQGWDGREKRKEGRDDAFPNISKVCVETQFLEIVSLSKQIQTTDLSVNPVREPPKKLN